MNKWARDITRLTLEWQGEAVSGYAANWRRTHHLSGRKWRQRRYQTVFTLVLSSLCR